MILFELGQPSRLRYALWSDLVDAVYSDRPKRPSPSHQSKECHGRDRLVVLSSYLVLGWLLSIGLDVEPPDNVSTHLDDTPMRCKVVQSTRDCNSLRLLRLGSNAVDRITFGIEWTAAQLARRVALDCRHLRRSAV